MTILILLGLFGACVFAQGCLLQDEQRLLEIKREYYLSTVLKIDDMLRKEYGVDA